MRVHVLGICGTFMGGIARLARTLGDEVRGADSNVYPPMSTQLREAGIDIIDGYDPRQLEPAPDLVLVGNALSRGNPCVEAMLDRRLDYLSGPEWLYRHVLLRRTVIAVAGTHGKTTTAAMIAWILDRAGREPGFLIGGVPSNFGVSARLGGPGPFVVEADEYDTAFFDKRSKFVHYRPQIAVLNNLEFDHADIFDDIGAIRRQFHHLVRTIPASGRLLVNGADAELAKVLAMGCWTAVERFGDGADDSTGENRWSWRPLTADGSVFDIRHDGRTVATVDWPLFGRHNAVNGLAAVAATAVCGVDAAEAAAALAAFRLPRRRLELVHDGGGIAVFEDFAHHPTAIRETLAALRARFPRQRLLAVLDPRSNTMRMGAHGDAVAGALRGADLAWIYARGDLRWRPPAGATLRVQHSVVELVEDVVDAAAPGDRIAVMSNGSFDGFLPALLARLEPPAAAGSGTAI